MIDNLAKFRKMVGKISTYNSINGVEKTTTTHPFDDRNIHPSIMKLAKKLFDNGHYSQATFEAFKFIDKVVGRLSKSKLTGVKLMMDSFNEKTPKVRFNSLTSSSEIDEQQGYKFIFAGSVFAIRNPRGHEVNLPDSVDQCLDHLSLASLLMRALDRVES